MIYLDTHVIVWLHINDLGRISRPALKLIDENDLLISPVVLMELDFLKEIGRLRDTSSFIYDELNRRINVRICDRKFEDVVRMSSNFTWTRDPFDRIIVAYAALNEDRLISRDRGILDHYRFASW